MARVKEQYFCNLVYAERKSDEQVRDRRESIISIWYSPCFTTYSLGGGAADTKAMTAKSNTMSFILARVGIIKWNYETDGRLSEDDVWGVDGIIVA